MIALDHYKTCVDPSGSYIASSCSDKTIRIINLSNGNCVSKLVGGDASSGVVFTQNGKHLITATADGCMFVWRVPQDMRTNI